MSSSTVAVIPRNSDELWTPAHWFWAFTVGHVLLWTLATWCTLPNVPLDTAEMVYWGHEWQWGYFKHPPLAAWIAEAAYVAGGNSVVALFLTARILIGVCFWGVWSLARRLVSERTALLAVVALEASYFFTYRAYDINNNMVARPFQVLAVLFLFLAIFERRFWGWLAAGVCLGLGMLSKYDTALLALSMLGYSLWEPRGRQAWRTPGPYAMLAAALLIFSPHVAWLVENDFPTIGYVAKASRGREPAPAAVSLIKHVTMPAEFLLGQIALLIPLVVLCAAGLKRRFPRLRLDEARLAKRQFLLILGLGPAAGFALVSAIFGSKPSLEWGHNLGTWVPLLIFLFWEADDSLQRLRPILRWCLAIGLIFFVVGIGRTATYPYLKGRGLARHYPGQELARQVEMRWHERISQPLSIIAGPAWTASNIALYSHDRPQSFPDLNPKCSPWTNERLLGLRGGIIVWEADQPQHAVYATAVSRFPGAYLAEPVVACWHTNAKVPPVKLQVAIIPPAHPEPAAIGQIALLRRENRR